MISLVIPVQDEADNLQPLYTELVELAQGLSDEVEIVWVDDGSSDDTWKIIRQFAVNDRRVRAIRFRRNFGKAAALQAGFETARGETVITMDGDLQDDPTEIPRFLKKLEEGFDVVSGWKKVRHDPWHKTLPSLVFNWSVSRLTGVDLHDHNCGFKCYRRAVLEEIHLYAELHRFVPVLADARGFRVGELVVHHRPRTHGRSKYGFWRIPKGFLDLLTVKFLTGYGQRPQHLLGTAGLAFFLVGTVGILALTIAWFWTRCGFYSGEPIHLTERAIFFYSIIALFFGGQLISIGFLGELLASYVARDQKAYSIAERIETDE